MCRRCLPCRDGYRIGRLQAVRRQHWKKDSFSYTYSHITNQSRRKRREKTMASSDREFPPIIINAYHTPWHRKFPLPINKQIDIPTSWYRLFRSTIVSASSLSLIAHTLGMSSSHIVSVSASLSSTIFDSSSSFRVSTCSSCSNSTFVSSRVK